ncbi:histidine kinase [Hymenobacter sp. 5317J-9]|uniref:sensor histidine kinase n=1 Tax=Hymenobacter sp. 5317J-9 TaxID=2932250 RepID=UPI001FD649C1|nr:histidine kinase [Hymenobacter sp. 5317J-9]UOQ99775.1 histidine kinase [Hymenobacter sp. 5317J-9]
MSGGPNRRVMRHAAFWLATMVLSYLMQLPAHFLAGARLYVGGILFVQTPAALLTIYPLLYGVLPRLLRGQFGLIMLLLLAWVPASVLVVDVLRMLYDLGPAAWFGEPVPATFDWSNYQDLGFAWFVLLVMAGAASTLKLLNHWNEQQRLGQELQQRKLHAELQLLKAQLQPPFLFDTLGTLRTLTGRKSPEAPGAVLHLAELLRYLPYASAREAGPLADEADMLRHYVALEALRLGPRIDVSLHFSGDLTAARIAPLLLLPLVENAFRHGAGPAHECPWVSIDLVAKPHSLVVKVINSRVADAANWQEGPGLRTLRARLARLYPGRHSLKLVAEPDTFLATLHLRAARPPEPPAKPLPTRNAAAEAFRKAVSSPPPPR